MVIGADREVFYVQLGGFDTVSNKQHNTIGSCFLTSFSQLTDFYYFSLLPARQY